MAGADYGDSLRATLDAARKQILDLGQSTLAQRQQAALTLGHAEQALSVAENKLARCQRDLSTAYQISGVAVQGGALIQSADQLAGAAQTASDSANNALSVAATSSRTLASAFDTLASSIAGVNAIASNDDAGSAMARAAKRAEQATDQADDVVEQLKAASIAASIQSAKSIAASAATSVNAVGGEVQELVDRAGALSATAQQRVSDSMKQRAAAAQAERVAQMVYRQAKIDAEALDDGTSNLDLVINGGLVVMAVTSATATSATQSSGSSASSGSSVSATSTSLSSSTSAASAPPAASLKVSYTVNGAATDRCYFFALPVSDAPGFSYNDAKTAVIDLPLPSSVGWTATPGTQQSGKSGTAQTYTATITTSATVIDETTGKPRAVAIAVGQSYRVFAYRVPLEGPYATNASDLSYPSRNVAVLNAIPNLAGYSATLTVPGQAAATSATSATASPTSATSTTSLESAAPIRLSVQLTAPSDAAQNLLEYRAFALLEDVYQAIKDDAAFLTGLLPSSSYKRVAVPSSGSASVVYREGDTDTYGDIITTGTNYEVLILLVPKDTDTMASSLLLAQPASGTGQGTPSTAGSSSTAASSSTSALARATPAATKPTPDGAPGPGAK